MKELRPLRYCLAGLLAALLLGAMSSTGHAGQSCPYGGDTLEVEFRGATILADCTLTKHGDYIRFCNRDPIYHSPFSINQDVGFLPPARLRPGWCWSVRLSNTGRNPKKLRINDAIHPSELLTLVVYPKRLTTSEWPGRSFETILEMSRDPARTGLSDPSVEQPRTAEEYIRMGFSRIPRDKPVVRGRPSIIHTAREGHFIEIEAAIEACNFVDSENMIEALPPGSKRDAYAERWDEKHARERRVRELMGQASAIELGNQDYETAIETLEEARTLSACAATIAAIDKAVDGLRQKLAMAPPEPPQADPTSDAVLVEGARWQCFVWYIDKVFYWVKDADLAQNFADTKFAQTHPYLQGILYNFVLVGHNDYVEGNRAREAYFKQIIHDQNTYFETELWPRYPWPPLQEGAESPFNPDTTLDETRAYMALMLMGMMRHHQEGETGKLEKDLKEFEDTWSGPPLARRPGFDVPKMFEMWRCDREMPS